MNGFICGYLMALLGWLMTAEPAPRPLRAKPLIQSAINQPIDSIEHEKQFETIYSNLILFDAMQSNDVNKYCQGIGTITCA